jgi:hypothetical protein
MIEELMDGLVDGREVCRLGIYIGQGEALKLEHRPAGSLLI